MLTVIYILLVLVLAPVANSDARVFSDERVEKRRISRVRFRPAGQP